MRHSSVALNSIAALLCAMPLVALAQANSAWPAKPITIVAPNSPGGTDVGLRLHTNAISANTRWPIVLDFKVGADGQIAANYVLRSGADGYTLLFSSTNLILTEIMEEKPPYDGWKDFTPVYQLSRNPLVLVVKSGLPVKSLKEYIAYAKANPGKLNYGMIGLSGINRLAGELLQSQMGVKVTFVPYKGSAPIGIAMESGELDTTVQAVRNLKNAITGGKIRALATTGGRISELPDLPSLSEQGVDFEYYGWVGIHAPAGTPATPINMLNAEFNKAAKQPDVLAKFEALGDNVGGGSVDDFRKYLAVQRDRWVGVSQKLGIKLGN